ncbi:MAG: peptidyl-prolyl cis-trans isomerase, EpsD family [Betaproteobacteria bacterium]|nr:peptidyl-prolyl cis-trans isomerase, EpsD family [Betaproteobacteria bacterium]
MKPTHFPLAGATLLALSLSLSGCNEKKAEDGAVAQVNGQVIRASQLDYEVTRQGKLPPEQAKAATRQALRNLADRQLLAQQALAEKLDQNPQVQQALESVRAQVLASAWLDKTTGAAAQPTQTEMADYYNANPWLFSERRIYKLQEINLRGNSATVAEAKARLSQTGNLNDFIQWLRERGIQAQAGQSVKPAEQLPLEILPKLHALKPGQIMAMPVEGGLLVVQVADAQTRPVDQTAARPVIERYLSSAKKRDAAQVQLQALRDKAKIEYLGEYADLGKPQPALTAQPPK